MPPLTAKRSLAPKSINVSDDEEPLEDTTVAIPLRSKRTERMQRRKATRDKRQKEKPSLLNLPVELLLDILELLTPSDVFSFSLVTRRFHRLVSTNASALGDEIIKQRYALLAKCLPLPVPLADIDPSVQALLIDEGRQQRLAIHRKPYQHVQSPDPCLVCTCLTCIMTWNNLGLVLDFAHWQDNLDSGEPIPILPRGKVVEWNEALVARNARIVHKAMSNSLHHARILETHLGSTIRSIRRQGKNKGNKRIHVDMTEEEAATGTDHFLEKKGPLSLEFPFTRDNYYMLYVPTSPVLRSH